MKKIVILLLCFILGACCITDNGRTGRHEKAEINITINGPGRVFLFPQRSFFLKGDTVNIIAEAFENAVFVGWELDTASFSNDNLLTIQVEGDMNIRAIFAGRPGNMVYISARDSVFYMGSNSPKANNTEKPLHAVKFTYDFFISANEVTVGEYNRVMSDINERTGNDDEDSLPKTNISWYDAIIYCNSKSKIEGYDTVYSYTARCKEAGSCPYILENLKINYNRFGYRLPTEAEWEYSCRAGGNEDFFWGSSSEEAGMYAWYFDNSGNRLHPVGLKQPNRFGLFDMAGNAAEWVNDWLGIYIDSLFVNPVGPTHLTQEQFEASWERPVRGGSYRLSIPFLRSSCRKGPYEMTYAGTQIDIGFRTAMGAFIAPNTPAGIMTGGFDSLEASIVCNKSDIIRLVGTHRAKAAFVYTTGRNRRCALVDFSASPVRIVKCSDDSMVCQPTISPDGKYIAWGSKEEGTSGFSMITVRALSDTLFPLTDCREGFLPRWWIDNRGHDTFIVFTNGASLNSQPQWYTEKTFRQKISGGKLQGQPEPLWETGSYHGGLSSDGRFLGTAYPRAKLVDLLLSDTNIYYFVPPWNGRTDTPQVCNFSMSPSRSEPGEALFLDFGCPVVSTLVGKSYGFHSVLFIANTRLFTEEHISAWFEPPEGYDRWNFTEWTNYPGAIAAVAQTITEGDDDALVIINRTNGACERIISGKNLRDVAVWIDPSEVSETDDPYRCFGKYDVPIQTGGQITLAKKLRLFWHERDKVSCIAIGNSPAYYGFDPASITCLKALNIAWPQSSIGTSITIALQYVLLHATQLRVIVLDLDASYFNVDCRTSLPRLTGLYDSKGYELDSINGFYRNGIPLQIAEKAAAFNETSWNGFSQDGAQLKPDIGAGWGEPIIEGRDYSIHDSIVRENILFLEALIDSAAARNIYILAVNYPQNPRYRETGMAGRAGPSRSTYMQLDSVLHEIEMRKKNFGLYDANNFGNHDYTDDEAFDTNHLNYRGAKKLTTRIDSLLREIIK